MIHVVRFPLRRAARRRPVLLAAVLAALLPAALLMAAPARAETPAGIHVSGTGEMLVVPDMARLTLEVRREGTDAAALKRELDAVTEAILELTDELDIERRDVTAAAVNVYPRYRRHDDETVPDGVVASRTVEVTLRALDDLGTLINGALERGANGVNGVALDASNRAELERRALDLAIDDAKAAAQQIAGRFEVTLGALVDASAGGQTPQPLRMAGMAEMKAADSAFSPGEMTIRRDVQATFSIRP